MPELPDIAVYIEALEGRAAGARLAGIRVAHPFLLRTVDPPLAMFEGCRLEGLRRLGKRIALGFEGDLWLVLHLMIAGRLHWADPGAAIPTKRGLAALDFEPGTLILVEAGAKKRAALHAVRGSAGLAAHEPGGLEVMDSTPEAFADRLRSANHTLKRALTDPRLLSGIGNAYSDEILHRARLSPVAMTASLDDAAMVALHAAARDVLREWTERLRAEAAANGGWPPKVTAFHEAMAVHGRYGAPCPDCGTPVQRIRYATNETNYCPRCQTGGRVLADRALARLLKRDWPRTVEELEKLGR